LKPPRLRISSLLKDFAVKVGEINVVRQAVTAHDAVDESETDYKSETESESDSEAESKSDTEAGSKSKAENDSRSKSESSTKLLDPKLFPLLHSLSIDSDTKMDQLIQEVLKLHGGKTVKFTGGNNRPGCLVTMPCLRSIKLYVVEFSKKGSLIDILVQHVAQCSNCLPNEAAECIIQGFLKKFEESFATVAIENGVTAARCKMDEASVEAMLTEASVNTANARIIFRHLNQFFGHSFFASEKKRRAYFSESDYPPTVDKEVLPDKTVIPFWYKEPHLLLQRQVNKILNTADLPSDNSRKEIWN
jgi:hypothetical protein